MKKEKSAWKKVKLGEVCQEYSKRNRQLLCDKVYSVTNSYGFIPSESYFDNSVHSSDISNYKIVEKGMLAYNPSRINVGSIAIQETEDRVVVSPLYVVFKVNKEIIPSYLLRFLKSNIGLNEIKSKTSGSVRLSLKFKTLCDISILLPPLSIQQSIAAELDSIQEMITKFREQLEDYDKLAQSIFFEMFGDPINNDKEWSLFKLKHISKIGTGATPSRKISEYYDGNIPWVKTTEVANGYIYDTQEKITDQAITESNCKIYPINTVLLAMYGQGKTRCQSAVLKIPAATNQACAAIQCSEKLNPIYLFWNLQCCYNKNRELGKGTNQKNMNLSIVGELIIPLPPFDMQQKFATKIEKIESIKEQIKSQIADLQQLFDSRMQYYFK